MKYENIGAQSFESLLNKVQGLASVASADEVQSIMAVVARSAIELGNAAAGFNTDIQKIRTQLSELTNELQLTRSEMAHASDVASKHTASLALWTKILAVATAVYAVSAGAMLYLNYVALSRPHP